jgi:hypothetical protein
MAKATLPQKSGDKSWLTTPRMPLVPNNLFASIPCVKPSQTGDKDSTELDGWQ